MPLKQKTNELTNQLMIMVIHENVSNKNSAAFFFKCFTFNPALL